MVIPMFFYLDEKSYSNINSFPIIFKLGITNPNPLKRISSSRLGRTRKEVWKIYSQLFFSFPGSLIFTMVTPLHFAHFDHLTPRDTSQGIKDPDRIFCISQIILNTKILHR
jgi:hypothetical protein